MSAKPVLALARTLPEAVEARAARDYAARPASLDTPPLGEDALVAHAAGADGLLVAPGNAVTAAVIDALPDSVRIIATFSVGFDHIDVEAARARGLIVTNTPDVLTDATADIALLCLLGAARRAGEGEALMRAGTWTGWTPTQMMGTHITGKRLGIIGMGRIGRAMARRCRAFGMKIVYHNRHRLPHNKESALDAEYLGLEDLLTRADAVSLHCPLTPETRHLINAERLALMKPTAYLVNTARGDIIDESALVRALEKGAIQGAGLDVYEFEPKISKELMTMDNVVLLPHIGSATKEARSRMSETAARNVIQVLDGGEPDNLIPELNDVRRFRPLP